MDGYLPISWLVRQPIGAQRGYEPILLFVDGVAHGEALATLGATTAQNSTTPTVFHTGHKTVLVNALTIVRLECSFHDKNLSMKNKIFLRLKFSKMSAFIKGLRRF